MTKEERIALYNAQRLALEGWQKQDKIFSCYGHKQTFEEVARNVGKGWHRILEDLFVKWFFLGWNGEYVQIKEKFGALRVYADIVASGKVEAELFQDALSAAEAESSHYCEECGDYGRIRKDGWHVCLCHLCAYTSQKEMWAYELDLLKDAGHITKEEADAYPNQRSIEDA
jgi:hypothetical protein